MDSYFKIGKLVATYALKGEIILQHSLGKKTSLKGLESLFIEEKKTALFHTLLNQQKLKAIQKPI